MSHMKLSRSGSYVAQTGGLHLLSHASDANGTQNVYENKLKPGSHAVAKKDALRVHGAFMEDNG